MREAKNCSFVRLILIIFDFRFVKTFVLNTRNLILTSYIIVDLIRVYPPIVSLTNFYKSNFFWGIIIDTIFCVFPRIVLNMLHGFLTGILDLKRKIKITLQR